MQQQNISAFAQAFKQNGALTLQNILPEDLALRLYEEFNSLDWVLQVKDYQQEARFEVPLSEVSNPDNLVEAIYSNKHEIDLNNLFYVRLAVASENLVSENMKQVADFLNSENFIDAVKQIVEIDDITHAWSEATCYEKSCFLGSHLGDHPPENRVAFVLSLTKEWQMDWGGLLMMEIDPNKQPLLVPPTWNTFNIFRIPVNHAVTSVSQAATGKRYSITGWFRP